MQLYVNIVIPNFFKLISIITQIPLTKKLSFSLQIVYYKLIEDLP